MNLNNNQRQFFTAAAFCPIGAFVLRYMMRKNELLANGSIAEGSIVYKILPIICLLFALGTIVIFWRLERHTEWSRSMGAPMPAMMLFCAAALLGIGNILLWYNGQTPASIYVASAPEFAEFLTDLLPPLGIIAAICMGFFAYRCYMRQPPHALLYMCVSLYLVIRLIVCFQAWNTDPSIHDYCYALLANIFAMLGTFHVAGFSLGKGKRRMCLFCLMCSIIFCSITIADGLYDADYAEITIHLALTVAAVANCLQILSSNEKTEDHPLTFEE